jgi:drug/metabolite transporter (DMT)-like permease
MAIFASAARASGVDTPTLLLVRFSVAGAILWAALAWKAWRRRAQPRPALARGSLLLPRGQDLLILALMGALGYAGQAFAFFTALALGSAGLAALLLYLYPALVAILARLVFKHPLTSLQATALALALVGSILTVGRAGDARPAAVFFGLLAPSIYAVYILAGSRVSPAPGSTGRTAVVVTSAAVVYAAVALARGLALPRTGAGWGAIAAIALLGTVLAIGFFLAGLERIGPVRASVYSTVEPAFTLVLADLFLGEETTWPRVVGGGLIVGAVLLLARADLAGAATPATTAAPEPPSP